MDLEVAKPQKIEATDKTLCIKLCNNSADHIIAGLKSCMHSLLSSQMVHVLTCTFLWSLTWSLLLTYLKSMNATSSCGFFFQRGKSFFFFLFYTFRVTGHQICESSEIYFFSKPKQFWDLSEHKFIFEISDLWGFWNLFFVKTLAIYYVSEQKFTCFINFLLLYCGLSLYWNAS